MQQKRIKMQNRRGFTLSELMVAAAILVLTISALLYVFVSCLLMNEANSELITAASDAEYVLEQIKACAYIDIDSYTVPTELTNPLTAHLRNEQIPPPLVVGSDDDPIRTVTVTVRWSGRNGFPRAFTLVTQIART